MRLQPLQVTDYEKLVEFSINEPNLWSFNANGSDNPENLKKYIDKALSQKNKQLEYPFVGNSFRFDESNPCLSRIY